MSRTKPLLVVSALLVLSLAALVVTVLVLAPRSSNRPTADNGLDEIAKDARPRPSADKPAPFVLKVDEKPAPTETVSSVDPVKLLKKLETLHGALSSISQELYEVTEARIGKIASSITEKLAQGTKLCDEALIMLNQSMRPADVATLERIRRMMLVLADEIEILSEDNLHFAAELADRIAGRIGELYEKLERDLAPKSGPVVERTTEPKKTDPLREPSPPPTPTVIQGEKPLTVHEGQPIAIRGSQRVTDLHIEKGGNLTVSGGQLTVTGNLTNEGTISAESATLILSGASQQTLSGNVSAQRIRMSGGEKRLTAGAKFSTTMNGNSNEDEPALFIEAGSTLVIEKDAHWSTTNPFGVRVAGTLIVDGGTFQCSFTNGEGHKMNRTWQPGSILIVRDGKFIGNGDAEFKGASVYVQGGELRINDDIWHSGDVLEISGGVMSNTSHGGMFALNGVVRITGGRLEINQSDDRGLQVRKEAEVTGYYGEVVIGGWDVHGTQHGIVLARDVVLPNLQINRNTTISDQTPETTTLTVYGTINIAKNKKLMAQGRRVVGAVATGDDKGVFVP